MWLEWNIINSGFQCFRNCFMVIFCNFCDFLRFLLNFCVFLRFLWFSSFFSYFHPLLPPRLIPNASLIRKIVRILNIFFQTQITSFHPILAQPFNHRLSPFLTHLDRRVILTLVQFQQFFVNLVENKMCNPVIPLNPHPTKRSTIKFLHVPTFGAFRR